MTITVLSREVVRDEIATGLTTALVGTGKPVKSVLNYLCALHGESPVVHVVSGTIDRTIKGLGAKCFDNKVTIEIHVLIYDGEKAQPLTEAAREDKADEIEAAIATWIVNHQLGTSYKKLSYASPTERGTLKMVGGEPYQYEIIEVQAEAPDYDS